MDEDHDITVDNICIYNGDNCNCTLINDSAIISINLMLTFWQYAHFVRQLIIFFIQFLSEIIDQYSFFLFQENIHIINIYQLSLLFFLSRNNYHKHWYQLLVDCTSTSRTVTIIRLTNPSLFVFMLKKKKIIYSSYHTKYEMWPVCVTYTSTPAEKLKYYQFIQFVSSQIHIYSIFN